MPLRRKHSLAVRPSEFFANITATDFHSNKCEGKKTVGNHKRTILEKKKKSVEAQILICKKILIWQNNNKKN